MLPLAETGNIGLTNRVNLYSEASRYLQCCLDRSKAVPDINYLALAAKLYLNRRKASLPRNSICHISSLPRTQKTRTHKSIVNGEKGSINALCTFNTGLSSNKKHQIALTGLKASVMIVNIRKKIKSKHLIYCFQHSMFQNYSSRMHRSSRSCSVKNEKAERTLSHISWTASSRQARLSARLFTTFNGYKAFWLCCTFCSALLCACLSCTFVFLHFQHLLHGQGDWMAPCSSDLLSCLENEQQGMTWQDGIAENPSQPKSCQGLSSLQFRSEPSDAPTGMSSSVLTEEIPPISLELHHTSPARAHRLDSRIPWRTSSVLDNWKVKIPASFRDYFFFLPWFVWFLFLLSYVLQPPLLFIGF